MILLFLIVFAVAGIELIFHPPLAFGVAVAIGYACISLVFIAANLYIFCTSKKSGNFVSALPLFGGLYGAIAIAMMGGWVRWLFWIPIVMDWGCLVVFVTIYKVLTEKKR